MNKCICLGSQEWRLAESNFSDIRDDYINSAAEHGGVYILILFLLLF